MAAIPGQERFHIQKKVWSMEVNGGSLKEEVVMTRLQLGHNGLIKTLHLIRKHSTIRCECGMDMETVEHVIINYE